MKNIIKRIKSAVSNEKGMELVQMLGIAAIAIVLVSVIYVALDGSFDTWLSSIDTKMDSLINLFNITTN